MKLLKLFNADHQHTLRRALPAHLATSTYAGEPHNAVLLGPPRVGKPYLAIALGYKTIAVVHAVQSDMTVVWVARPRSAHAHNRLEAELRNLRRYKLLTMAKAGSIRSTPKTLTSSLCGPPPRTGLDHGHHIQAIRLLG